MKIKIASRKSDLARIQAYTVGNLISGLRLSNLSESKLPNESKISVEYHFRESLGDRNLIDPLWQAPEKGVFTEDFYQDLAEGKVDLVVHSWKDLPVVEKEKTFIAATLPREDARDILFVKKSARLEISKTGFMKILSSSPRRIHNLRNFAREYLPLKVKNSEFVSVRGNIATRFKKLLQDPSAHGLLVAKAAVDRLLGIKLGAKEGEFKQMQEELKAALELLDWTILPLSINPTAAAQGALAIEVRRDRSDLIRILDKINHVETYRLILEERNILKSHGGGCHQAIGVNLAQHTFGKVIHVLGKTEKGENLNQHDIQSESLSHVEFCKRARKLKGLNVAESDFFKPDRQFHNLDAIPELKALNSKTQRLLVSKADAWPVGFNFSGEIWSAGLSTWKKLVASHDVWVHGSLDGLGERLEETSQQDETNLKSWVKLTHSESHLYSKTSKGVSAGPSHNRTNLIECVGTYKLTWRPKPSLDLDLLKSFDHFYWSSASLFRTAIELCPELLLRVHCSGPGITSHTIEKILLENGKDPSQNLFIFLDGAHWKLNTH